MTPDPDFVILTLTEENARLRRALQFIADHRFTDGYRQAFYTVQWHARTTLTGTVSPSRSPHGREASSR